MILTYKIKHNRDFSNELKQAFKVAESVVIPLCNFSRYSFPGGNFKIKKSKSRSSKSVKNMGLPSVISNQVLRKYGNQKTIKEVHNVNLIVPNQGIKLIPYTNSIWISSLKLNMANTIPADFEKINQIELDNKYAYISVTVLEKPEMIPRTFIGVDLNTTGHIVVTANPYTGKVEKFGKSALYVHQKYSNIRKHAQRKKNFRIIKQIKDREHRIVKDLNHKISKKLVEMAKTHNAELVFEKLSGIRQTRKQHHSFKYALHSWSFYQLQQFVEYKAKLLGVPVVYVNPAYTSQDCSRCGARGNRIGKDFKCPTCGHVDHADVNAAFNIAFRQKNMVDRVQKEMCTMGALIPHDALLDVCPVTSEPHDL